MNKELSEKFFNAWKNICSKNVKNLLNFWSQKKSYSAFMLYDDKSIIKEVARALSLECYSECRYGYYGIDSVLYENNFKISNKGSGTWLRKINIAFEHENDFNYYLDEEISRLLTSNADLKVLVTYPKQKDKERIIKYLKSLFLDLDDEVILILGSKNNDAIYWEKVILNKDGNY